MFLLLFGIALVVFGLMLAVRELEGKCKLSIGTLIVLAGWSFVSLAFARRQRERVDEIWKEYDTHVKYCGCMTREYDIDRDGGGK